MMDGLMGSREGWSLLLNVMCLEGSIAGVPARVGLEGGYRKMKEGGKGKGGYCNSKSSKRGGGNAKYEVFTEREDSTWHEEEKIAGWFFFIFF